MIRRLNACDCPRTERRDCYRVRHIEAGECTCACHHRAEAYDCEDELTQPQIGLPWDGEQP